MPQTWLITGNAFPEDVLTGGGGGNVASNTDKPPKGDKHNPANPSPGQIDAITTVQRKRPPEKTPLMIGGGLVVAGAGGIYFLAYESKQKFNDAKMAVRRVVVAYADQLRARQNT